MQIVIVKGFGSGLGFVAYGLSTNCHILAQKTLTAAKTSAYYSVAPSSSSTPTSATRAPTHPLLISSPRSRRYPQFSPAHTGQKSYPQGYSHL